MRLLRLPRLLGAAFAASVRRDTAARASVIAQLLQVIVASASVVPLLVVYSHVSSLRGWSMGQAIALLGTFQVVTGLKACLLDAGSMWFPERVRDGQFDAVLLQPAPSVLAASMGTPAPLALAQALVGLTLVGAGLARLGTVPSPLGAFAWLALVASGLAIGWAARVVMMSLAFWAPRLDFVILFESVWRLGCYPVQVYRQPVRFVLTYLLPVAFVATIPAQALVHRFGPLTLGSGVAAATLAVLCALLAWGRGLRRYTSATT